jgi:IclR family pca regulon transcriptional regulator
MNMDVKSAGRILDMLEMFAATTETMGVSRVAEKLGIPKSSAQALLATLTGRGYLAKLGVEYVLPAELRGGSWVGGTRSRLLFLAAPVLKQLSEKSGESAFLSVLSNDEVQDLLKVVSPHDIRYDLSLAHKRPLYCTGSGIVMLAQQRPEVAKAMLSRLKLKAHTPNTVTDRNALLRWVERVKREGFAVSRGGYSSGGFGIAAPVIGPTGEALATISIGGPTERMKASRKRFVEIVTGQAAGLSRRLSGLAIGGASGI